MFPLKIITEKKRERERERIVSIQEMDIRSLNGNEKCLLFLFFLPKLVK